MQEAFGYGSAGAADRTISANPKTGGAGDHSAGTFALRPGDLRRVKLGDTYVVPLRAPCNKRPLSKGKWSVDKPPTARPANADRPLQAEQIVKQWGDKLAAVPENGLNEGPDVPVADTGTLKNRASKGNAKKAWGNLVLGISVLAFIGGVVSLPITGVGALAILLGIGFAGIGIGLQLRSDGDSAAAGNRTAQSMPQSKARQPRRQSTPRRNVEVQLAASQENLRKLLCDDLGSPNTCTAEIAPDQPSTRGIDKPNAVPNENQAAQRSGKRDYRYHFGIDAALAERKLPAEYRQAVRDGFDQAKTPDRIRQSLTPEQRQKLEDRVRREVEAATRALLTRFGAGVTPDEAQTFATTCYESLWDFVEQLEKLKADEKGLEFDRIGQRLTGRIETLQRQSTTDAVAQQLHAIGRDVFLMHQWLQQHDDQHLELDRSEQGILTRAIRRAALRSSNHAEDAQNDDALVQTYAEKLGNTLVNLDHPIHQVYRQLLAWHGWGAVVEIPELGAATSHGTYLCQDFLNAVSRCMPQQQGVEDLAARLTSEMGAGYEDLTTELNRVQEATIAQIAVLASEEFP